MNTVIKKFDSMSKSRIYPVYNSLIKKRIFIVGCPRSGTTLLQGMLSAHPDIHSVPETFFFSRAFVSKNPVKKFLLWPAIKVRRHFENLIMETDKTLSKSFYIGIFQSDYYRPFVDFMDFIALKNNKTSWVEKTPMHLYCIEEIQSKIPDAYVVHVVRDGLDVVQSLVKATTENPVQWAKFGGWWRKYWKGYSVDEAIKLWNHDFSLTKKSLNNKNNILIKYEDLISTPSDTLLNLCNKLYIKYDAKMIDSGELFNTIVREHEIWKNNCKKNVTKDTLNESRIDSFDVKYIKSKLVLYDV